MSVSSTEVPYGTEVFIIVPEEHVAALDASKDRLFASLQRQFPRFEFSLGRSVSNDPSDFVIMTVAGKVGDGWQKSRPVSYLESSERAEILRHLHQFVDGDVAKVN